MFLFAFHNFFSEPDSTVLFRGQFLDFNMRWYQVIGVPIITAIFFQIFTPHFGLILNQVKMSILRCWDRRCTLNKRKTRQITQEEYEDIYSGPEFILHLRFAQLNSMIFVTMTYSSGLPILYLVAFLSLFFTYWIDKFLMLRYFKVANQFTEANSRAVVNILPWAAIFHFIFGYMLYSYPDILRSK
jgi:hypothetical protein